LFFLKLELINFGNVVKKVEVQLRYTSKYFLDTKVVTSI